MTYSKVHATDLADYLCEWRETWRSLDTAEQHGRLNMLMAAVDGQPVPRQLPAPPAGFVGRHEELRTLGRWYSDSTDTPPILIVTGACGIGKSALLLRWAHSVADDFPDGQLFADLGPRNGDGPTKPEICLRGFLSALGVPKSYPDIGDQAAQYRSALSGKRVLIVLDNAEDVNQVRPLLPGDPDCAVIVSSRHDLADLVVREGARRLAVEPLESDHARLLLEAALKLSGCKVDMPERHQVLAEAGGYPLALRQAAERLTARHLANQT
jgi:hypothetical protein